jgi:hypothetical protein
VKRLLLSASAVSLVLVASPSRAEDFEFAVPVQLSKLDSSFAQGKVTCEVRKGLGAISGMATGREGVVIGSGEATFPITQGAYNGTVAVRFNAKRPEFQPAQGETYRCMLHLLGAGGLDGLLCSLDEVPRASGGQATGRTPGWLKLDGKNLKGCVSGNLPH